MRVPTPIIAAVLAATAAALPAQTPAAPSTLALSPAERQDLLERNTEQSSAQAQAGLGGGPSIGRQVHGEIGMMVGTHGARGIYGAADIPLGENAGASVMFEDSRYGLRR